MQVLHDLSGRYKVILRFQGRGIGGIERIIDRHDMAGLSEHPGQGGPRPRAEVQTTAPGPDALLHGGIHTTQESTVVRIVRAVFVQIVMGLFLLQRQELRRWNKHQLAAGALKISTMPVSIKALRICCVAEGAQAITA